MAPLDVYMPHGLKYSRSVHHACEIQPNASLGECIPELIVVNASAMVCEEPSVRDGFHKHRRVLIALVVVP